MELQVVRSTELVSVPFRGDAILAVNDDQGGVRVVIKRICESLGVDFSSQLTKLKGHHWAGVAIITTPDSRGCEQRHSVIPLDRLPMWLATIDVRKVAESLREKLMAYQVEAVEVLSRHFFGAKEVAPVKDPVLAQLESLCEVRRLQLEHDSRLVAVESNVTAIQAVAASAESKADAALALASGATGYVTVRGYCNIHGLRLTRQESAEVGALLRKISIREGLELRKTADEDYGEVRIWPVELLDRWRTARLRKTG